MTSNNGQLIVQFEDRVVQVLPIVASVLTIGRLPDNDLTLDDQLVSRKHAEIRLEEQGPVLTDLGSANGTLVDGAFLPPHQPRLLVPGTVIQIGPFALIYRAAGASEAESASLVPEAGPADDSADMPDPADEAVTAEPVAPDPVDEEVSVAPITPEPDAREPDRAAPYATNLLPDDALEPPVEAAGPDGSSALEPSGDSASDDGDAGAPPPGPATPTADLPAYSGTRRWNGRVASRYLQHLPIIFHDNDFLGRYLLIFESLWEPLEQRQDFLDMYFDPRTCPESFLGWLASWLGITLNQHWPVARRRLLLSEAFELYRWRGTRYGLARMLEICTGLTPEITDGEAQPFVFRIRLTIPPESGVEREFIEELIQAHKPAHAGYILELNP